MTAKRDPEPPPAPPDEPEGAEILRELAEHSETHPGLTGGDLDADWQRAWSDGEEAVGGSVATPDQDVVDELGRALGVEQPLDAEVRTSEEILGARDRFYWHLERDAEAEAEPPETEGGPGTPPPPRARS